MDKKELEQFETEVLKDAKSCLSASVEYLNAMLQYFDGDTRKLYAIASKCLAIHVKAGFKDGPEYTEWQIYERAVIRALFAEIEGMTAAMRQVVLWAQERGEFPLSEIEEAKLSEKHRFNTCKDNFNLAFRYFPALFGSDYRVDKKDPRWNSFINAIKIRDSIMHPKTPFGFLISGDAALDIESTVHWFNDTYTALIKSIPKGRARGIGI